MVKNAVKLERGTIYQKEDHGVYFYRYQVNRERKALSLKTKNKDEAIAAAKALIPVINASSAEVIAAHVLQAKSLKAPQKNLVLSNAWEKYSIHPDRATPRTVEEKLSYKATLELLIRFLDNSQRTVRDVSAATAEKFSEYLKSTGISADTHNRKIKRLRKIFEVLSDYHDGENPFQSKTLYRREREDQEYSVRRLSFTREQEQQILKVLDDPKYKVLNKPEIKVLYYLGMFTGQRLKDCLLLKWEKIDLKKKRMWVTQFKTGKKVSIPIAEQLKAELQKALEWKRDSYVLPNCATRYQQTDALGKNVGNNLVNLDVLRVIRWIGLEPSVAVPGRKRKVTVYGFHSLRHSFASHCAEAGIPKAVLLSILGTDSDIADKFYTHIGTDVQAKAIATLFGESTTDTETDPIAEALKTLQSSGKILGGA